jgi:signal transduction histidine kinase
VRVNRGAIDIATRIRSGLDALDDELSRLGRYGATAALTAIAVLAAIAMHFVLHVVEGEPMHLRVLFNVALAIAVVTAPIIFYARDVIDQMKRNRAHLDIMSRRLAVSVDQAESANKAKSAFLANMSHELRTPLNAIMGFSEIMKDQHLGPVNNPRYLSYAGDIHASGRYLLGIINDILDLSKIEAGKMSLESAEEFALCETLEGSIGMVTALGEKFGVRIETSLPPAGVRLVAVERMIRQIMINLVGNAIKFTPAGGCVTVSCAASERGGYAVIVKDSGIGMSDADIEKALTPFGQVENKLTATHNGTGLGLPLAKAMLELHGGVGGIARPPHQGTTITLHFPAERIVSGKARVAA